MRMPFRLGFPTLSVALAAGVTACVLGEDVAARAGNRVLTAERLADIVVSWRSSSVDTVLVRRVAGWWVDYQLFVNALVAGDSMIDSATVLDVWWSQARGHILARWREHLFRFLLPLDSAAVDSIYHAGDYRLIQHVLFQGPDRGPPDARHRARRRAEALHHQLARGLSWEAAQRQSDDVNARLHGGSVGVITRGQTEPEFERTAFGLAPGARSAVFASSRGYHIARRPLLREVRAEFHAAVEPFVAERLDSLHMDDLAKRWRLTLRPDGPELARAAVRQPLRYLDSPSVIATFEGGRFTLKDLVRWLEAVPDWMHSEIERDLERRLPPFLDLMMRYELLYHEALVNDVRLSSEEFTALKTRLAQRLDGLKEALGVYPPAAGDSATIEEAQRGAADKVDRYLATLPADWQQFAGVPTRLADRLKKRMQWDVHPRGIARTVELLERRAQDATPADPSRDTARVSH